MPYSDCKAGEINKRVQKLEMPSDSAADGPSPPGPLFTVPIVQDSSNWNPSKLPVMMPSLQGMGLAVPLVPYFISFGLYYLALGSQRRWLFLAPLLYCDYLALAGSRYWPSNGIDSLWGLMVCIWVSHSLSMLFLEDTSSLLLEGKEFGAHTAWQKYWKTWNNPRLLFTSRSENVVPEQGKQSRLVFAGYRAGKLLMYYVLTVYIQPYIVPGLFVPLSPDDFDSTRQTLIRRIFFDDITMREISLRAAFAVYWAVGAYILVDAAHAALSLLFVLVRANAPHEWPPIYGSLRHASSLRGFWGQFWHRLVVLPYGNVGKLLAMWLGLKPRSLGYKLTIACCIFVLSGVVHAVVAYTLGDTSCWHLDIAWFFLNFVACTAESVVCKAARRQLGSAYNDNMYLWTYVGYAWVFLFFFWSVPKWQYPKVYTSIVAELRRLEATEFLLDRLFS